MKRTMNGVKQTILPTLVSNMKPITVREMYKMLEEQMKKGNGDKVILASSDDECNEYHCLWFSIEDEPKNIANVMKYTCTPDCDPSKVIMIA